MAIGLSRSAASDRILSPLDYPDRAKLDAIRAEAERLNLDIATIAGYTDFTAGRATPDIPLWEMQLAYVGELSRIAAVLGAKIVRVFSGYSPATENFQSDWQECVDGLRRPPIWPRNTT